MKYFKIVDDKIILTPSGQYALEFFNISFNDLQTKSIAELEGKLETDKEIQTGTRIPFKNDTDKEGAKVGFTYFGARNALELSTHEDYPKEEYNPDKGRFPANLLIQDGALDTGETTKSGKLELHHNISEDKNIYGEYKGRNQVSSYGDEGSPYRFFDLDAWAMHHGFLDVAKPSKAERDFGLEKFELKIADPYGEHRGRRMKNKNRIDGKPPKKARNTHPTVKPVRLMAYLIELGCPRNGVVLDPFAGSGTTCIAAKQLGRRYIGIEISEEYHTLAEARVAAYPQPLEWFQEAQDVR